jgi:hypothetical protein
VNADVSVFYASHNGFLGDLDVFRYLIIDFNQTMAHFEPFDVLVNPSYPFANHA